MDLANSRILINGLFNKGPYIVSGEYPFIVLYSKSAMCVFINGKDTKHTSHIARRIHLVRNGESFNIQSIDWCAGVLQLSEIDTKNVGEHDLTPIMKYIMVIIDN